jgi:hypothetical protein
MSHVFIIGGSRTGSELLKNFFRKYTKVDMVPEMFLLCPRWLHKDFATNVRQYAGGFGENCNLESLVDLMYSKKLYGQLWSVVDELDRSEMMDRLSATDRSLREIFQVIMDMHATVNNKTVQGAKFPLHYSYAELLFEWFPKCKLIHTVRDPRAIYSSQSNKYTGKEFSGARNTLIRAKQFTHISIQTAWTSRLHNKLMHRSNYMLSRYEDLVTGPRDALKRICKFVDIPYEDKMSNPELYNSNTSFGKAGSSGARLDKGSLDAWKTRINPATSRIICRLNKTAMKNFGYE